MLDMVQLQLQWNIISLKALVPFELWIWEEEDNRSAGLSHIVSFPLTLPPHSNLDCCDKYLVWTGPPNPGWVDICWFEVTFITSKNWLRNTSLCRYESLCQLKLSSVASIAWVVILAIFNRLIPNHRGGISPLICWGPFNNIGHPETHFHPN